VRAACAGLAALASRRPLRCARPAPVLPHPAAASSARVFVRRATPGSDEPPSHVRALLYDGTIMASQPPDDPPKSLRQAPSAGGIHIPHDSLFKAIFGDPAQAAVAIRAILPPRVARHIDWDSLRAVHASFVDTLLKQLHGDLVFSARLTDGREAFLWLLFEHQSTVDPWMSWRMLRMAVRFIDAWRAQHPDARRVPAVIPIVLYNGDTPWTAPRSFAELIDLSDEARRDFADYLLSYRLLVDDLPATPDEDIEARALNAPARLALVVLKHGSSATLLLHLRAHHHDIRELLATEHGRMLWTFIVRYIVPVNPYIDQDTIVRELGPAVGPQLSKAMLTYQQMIEEDRQLYAEDLRREIEREVTLKVEREVTLKVEREVRLKVEREVEREVRLEVEREVRLEVEREVRLKVEREVEREIRLEVEREVRLEVEREVRLKVEREVEREVRLEAQREVLLRQLGRRFGSLPESVTARIEAASLDEIERWADRILDATALDDVFSAP
jgi:hypothetical protein